MCVLPLPARSSPFGSIRLFLVPAHVAHVPGPGHVSQLTSASPQVTLLRLSSKTRIMRGYPPPPYLAWSPGVRRGHHTESVDVPRRDGRHTPLRTRTAQRDHPTSRAVLPAGPGTKKHPRGGKKTKTAHTTPPALLLSNENENGGRCGVPLNITSWCPTGRRRPGGPWPTAAPRERGGITLS
jgi:hypothetical protein